MRRIGRYILNALTLLSLMLLVAAVVLWVRSRHWRDTLGLKIGGRHYALTSIESDLVFESFGTWEDGPARISRLSRRESPDAQLSVVPCATLVGTPQHPIKEVERWGIGGSWGSAQIDGTEPLGWTNPPHEMEYWVFGAPYWAIICMLLLVSSPLPIALIARHVRRKRRQRQGRCVSCGYDLRSSPERCPECGRIAAEAEK